MHSYSTTVHPEEMPEEQDLCRASTATTNEAYLRASAFSTGSRRPSVESQSELFIEHYQMHCVTIEDLMSLDKMYDHHTLKEMNKLVVPSLEDDRDIIFCSHQWTGYTHPDPMNLQFQTLKGALQSLLDGLEVYPFDSNIGVPGMPKKRKCSKQLKNSLIWFDFMSVPQPSTLHRSKENDAVIDHHLHCMHKAIQSIPAYVHRSSLMLILAPVVPHADLDVDCQLSTWRSRGWCRLESVVGSLAGMDYMVLIESATKMSLFTSNDIITRDPAGCGEFTCCSRDHVIDIDGVPTTIPCDLLKVSKVLVAMFANHLEVAEWGDVEHYRWLLSHEHIILKNLPCADGRVQQKTWAEFSSAFKLERYTFDKPSMGAKQTPLIYATIANNFEVVEHIISQKANVNDIFKIHDTHALSSMYSGYAPMHLIMRNGSGEAGKKIFDTLMQFNADPYQYSRGQGSKAWRDPLSLGISAGNTEMCRHYMKRVAPRFLSPSDHFGGANELYAVAKGSPEIVQMFIDFGATFKSRNKLGLGVLAIFCMCAKDFQIKTDCRLLDILHDSGKLGDLNVQLMDSQGWTSTRVMFLVAWHLRRRGFLKTHALVRAMYCVGGGTALHAAVFRDKPQVISWLLEHGANPHIKNKAGHTPLELAQRLGHERGVCELGHGRRSSELLSEAIIQKQGDLTPM
eukprot:gene714-649_t